MTKLEFINELIKTIEDEFLNSEYIAQFFTKDGNIIYTDVGYAFKWFKEYKKILRKRYANIKGENDEIL